MNIEAGKFYQTRDGRVVGPIEKAGRGAFPFKAMLDGKVTFWLDAGFKDLDTIGHADDLVAEWGGEAGDVTLEPGELTIDPRDIAPASTGYGDLHAILQDAFDQSASGKGRERHANDKPFDRQPIMEIGRMVGPGYAIGQAMKKLQEAMTMQSRNQTDAADRELLGSIVYAAAAVKLIRETRAA